MTHQKLDEKENAMDDMTMEEIQVIHLDVFMRAKPIRTALTLGPTIAIEEQVYEAAKSEIEKLNAKLLKLKQLVLLVDPSMHHEEMNEMSATQWNEFIKEFPDEQ